MEKITHICRRSIVSWLIGATACLAVALAGSAQATAASTQYIAGDGSTFAGGAGGWTNASAYAGVCLPITHGITCPAMAGSFETTDGFGGDGDGFIRTSEDGTTLAALLATSLNIWTSPEFTYDGAGGGTTPDKLGFGLKVRSGFSSLLALGGDATYKVDAVDKSGGKDVNLVDTTSVGTAADWTSAPAVQLAKNALVVGHKYQFVITTSIGGLAAVIPAGTVDYDNAILTATTDTGGNGNGNGNGDGSGGGDGGVTGESGVEIAPPKVIPNGLAYLYKGKLFVRVRCPHRFKPKCHIKASVNSKKKKGKQLSKRVRLNVKAHSFKRKGLKIRPKFLAKVKKLSKSKKRTVWLTLKVKSKHGKKKGTVHYHLRVIHRVK